MRSLSTRAATRRNHLRKINEAFHQIAVIAQISIERSVFGPVAARWDHCHSAHGLAAHDQRIRIVSLVADDGRCAGPQSGPGSAECRRLRPPSGASASTVR